MDLWAIATDKSRFALISMGVERSNSSLIGYVVCEPHEMKSEARRISGKKPAAVIIDGGGEGASEDALKAFQFIKHVHKDKIKVFVLVEHGTAPGDKIVQEAILYKVTDIIDADADNIASELADILDSPGEYSRMEKWRHVSSEAPQQSSGIFSAVKKPEVVTKEVVVTKERVKLVGTPVITIAGVQSRVGSTHLALSLAEYFQNTLNLRCGLIVSPDSFDVVAKYYEIDVHVSGISIVGDKEVDSGKRKGLLEGIIFAAGIFSGDLSDEVDVVVWDTGIYSPSNPQFGAGNLRLLVSGGASWELEPLGAVFNKTELSELSGFTVAITLTPKEEFDELVEQMARLAGAVYIEIHPDWTDPTGRKDLPEIAKLAGLEAEG